MTEPDFSVEARHAALAAFQSAHGFSFEVKAAAPARMPAEIGGVSLRVRTSGFDQVLLVFDEYGDAQPGRPLLCTALVARHHHDMLDAGSAQAWARNESISPELCKCHMPVLEAHWQQNLEAMEKLQKITGPLPEFVMPLEWQLGSGLAYRLRT